MAESQASFDTSFSIACMQRRLTSMDRVVTMLSIKERISSIAVSCQRSSCPPPLPPFPARSRPNLLLAPTEEGRAFAAVPAILVGRG